MYKIGDMWSVDGITNLVLAQGKWGSKIDIVIVLRTKLDCPFRIVKMIKPTSLVEVDCRL